MRNGSDAIFLFCFGIVALIWTLMAAGEIHQVLAAIYEAWQ